MKKIIAITLALSISATAAIAAESKVFEIIIKNHTFEPATLEIPAGEKIKLLVKNQDPTPEEFESHDLKREKVIAANSEATINVGPLKAGEYKFFGEFNEATAQGKLVIK
jgi:plastocyanin